MMAALVRHIFGKISQQILQTCDGHASFVVQARGKRTSNTCKSKYKIPKPKKPYKCLYKNMVMGPTLESMAQSLQFKGYLRSHKPYSPPPNVADTVQELKSASDIKSGEKGKPFTLADKAVFLNLCAEKFNHNVPNSALHEICTISDAIAFYETPVDTTLPLDALKTVELPENLHIQHEYLRFHPDTDTKFGGISAYPLSSAIVTGLKYRKKYKGYEAKKKFEQ